MAKTLPTTLVVVSIATIRFAEKEIRSCRACDRSADITFSRVLDRITDRDGATTNYLMSEPAKCPNCMQPVFEETLVEWA